MQETKKHQEYHQGFPKHTEKETLVEVEGKIYRLVPHEHTTLRSLMDNWPEGVDTPFVRHLNPIPVRSKEEQKKYDADSRFLAGLARKARGETKITSVEKAIKLGADVPAEVAKLLEAKKKASPEEAKKIRQQLRKLDYKRYLKKREEE